MWQAVRIFDCRFAICDWIGIAILLLAPLAQAQAQSGPYSAQLARECDALIQSAVRRPYGWGWDTVPAVATQNSAPRHVMMDPPGTAAAGVLLLWAGQVLHEPKYQQAALEAARGVAAAQTPVGRVPGHVIFGPSGASSRDEPTVVPDRAATEAGMALMLLVYDPQTKSPDLIYRGAMRAAQWLAKQQTDEGGWPIPYPPDAQPHDTQRILRLDDSDSFSAAMALLLAADVLKEPILVKDAGKSAGKLLTMRLSALGEATTNPALGLDGQNDISPKIANLWTTAYRLNGTIDPSLKDFPVGGDALASRYAMQTLIGAYLMTEDKSAAQALDAAARSIEQLKTANGNWRKIYLLVPTTEPLEEEAPTGAFGAPASTQPQRMSGDYGLPQTLETVSQLRLLGRSRYLAMLTRQFSMNQHLTSLVCGLNDDPFSLSLPVSKDEASQYIQKHQSDWQTLSRPIPEDLTARIKRLWLLLIRTKIEKMQ